MGFLGTFSFICKMVRPFYWSIIVMALVSLVWAIDLSLRPYILKVILNRVDMYPAKEISTYLFWPAISYLGASFLMSTFYRLYGYFVDIKMIPNLRLRIADTIFSGLLQQSHHYYQNEFSGNLANKINDLVNSVPDILEIVMNRFLGFTLGIIIAVFTLWQVNLKFALAMLIWILSVVGCAYFLTGYLTPLADKWSELGSGITGKVVDVLSNILSVRLFSRQKKEKAFLYESAQEATRAEKKLQWAYFFMFLFYGYSFVATLGISLYFLIKGYEAGSVSSGDFALVLMINISIGDFLWNVTQDFSDFSRLLGKIIQALRITTVPIEVTDQPNVKELVVNRGTISFDKVKFQYNDGETLFEDKSVVIHAGQKVGLVGYSGGGKTTFVNLILRLFDVTAGSIKIDGKDIREVTQESLREMITTIPQDPSLFHRTLQENIRYGKLEASDEQIIAAAKQAHAHEFIVKLPLGYNTLVGERGIKLSGGQRQRIAIARAILKNAPILMLDEATSQLDSVTEAYIQESLWMLMQNKTTIIIAHRLSTLLHMDRILVFDKGRIVQDGSHESLLKEGGLYKTLWQAQVGGFLLDDQNQDEAL